jgi:hypothetical protein
MPLSAERIKQYQDRWSEATDEERQKLRAMGVPDPVLPTTPQNQLSKATTPAAITVPTTQVPPVQSPPKTTVPETLQWLPGAEIVPFLSEREQERLVLETSHLIKAAAALGINIGGTTAGGVVGAMTGPFAGAGIPLGAMGGSLLAREANKKLGLEEPGIGGDILAAAAPLIPPIVKGGKDLLKTGVRYSRAGRALTAADAETQAELEQWAAKTRELGTDYAAKQQAAAQVAEQATLEDRMKWAAQARQKGVEHAQAVHKARLEAAQATQEAQQAYQTRQAGAYQDALDKAKDAQANYRRAVQSYREGVQAQRQGVETARGIPPTFAPAVPSAQLYERFVEQTGAYPVSLTRANEAAQHVLQQLGGHFEALQPSRMQAIATEVLASQRASVSQVHQYLKDLGPLTRNTDGRIRGAAKQLYAGLQNALETVPEASGLLRQANAAARREFALEDLERLIRRAVHIGNDGFPRLDAGRIVTNLLRLGEEDTLFRGSFTAEEWRRLAGNVQQLTGLPQIPARVPAIPGPITVKDVGAAPGAVQPKNVPFPHIAPYPATVPPKAVSEPRYPTFPTPATPALRPMSGWRLGAELGIPLAEQIMRGHVGPYGAVGAGLAVADAVGYGLARILIQPNMQPLLRRMIQPSGHIDPRIVALFTGAVQYPWNPGEP